MAKDMSRRAFLAGALLAVAFPQETFAREKKKKTHKYQTSNLRKDSDDVLLARMVFGETRGREITDLERTAVAYTALNRARDTEHRWGNSLREVILERNQYSCFNPNDPNYQKVLDPESYDAKTFEHCLTIAREVNAGKRQDPVHANHYHESSLPRPTSWPGNVKLVGRLVVGRNKKGKPVYSSHTFYAG